MMVRSFIDLLTFGTSVAVVTLLVLTLSLCVALVLDYMRNN